LNPLLKNILNILIVDDNLNFINRMTGLLDEVRIRKCISTATNFNEAIQQLTVFDPHIVLLDIHMPGKNGIELLKYIRKKHRDAIVVMLTNHFENYYREQCIEQGARFFLDKSNDFLQVPEIVKEYYRSNNELSQTE
jgi:DNA-binding NarL/FixJ family response regulator